MNSVIYLRLVVGILVISGATAVAQIQSNGGPELSDAEKAVAARLVEIQDAAEALDPDKLFGFVLDNDKGALIQDGKFLLTRKAALQSVKRGFLGIEDLSYKFDQQHITLLSPTVALVTSEGASTATLSDGRSFNTRFAQSVVLKLENDEWKVFHAHRSFPPAE